MADVYGTSKVAVEVSAILDRESFENIDAFIGKFAKENQKAVDKMARGFKRINENLSGIVNTISSTMQNGVQESLSTVRTIDEQNERVAKRVYERYGKMSRASKRATKSMTGELKHITKFDFDKRMGVSDKIDQLKAEKDDLIAKWHSINNKDMEGFKKSMDLRQVENKIRSVDEQILKLKNDTVTASKATEQATQQVKPVKMFDKDERLQMTEIDRLKERLTELHAEWDKVNASDIDDHKKIASLENIEDKMERYEAKIKALGTASKVLSGTVTYDFDARQSMEALDRLYEKLDLLKKKWSTINDSNLGEDEKLTQLEQVEDRIKKTQDAIDKYKASQVELVNAEMASTVNTAKQDVAFEQLNKTLADAEQAMQDVDKRFNEMSGALGYNLTADAAIKDLEEYKLQLEEASSNAPSMWERLTVPSGKFSEEAEQIRNKIISIINEMQTEAGKITATKAYEKKMEEIGRITRKISEEQDRYSKMMDKGYDVNSTSVQNLRVNVEHLTSQLRQAQSELEAMEATGIDFDLGVNSNKYAKLSEELENYKVKLKEVEETGRTSAGTAFKSLDDAISNIISKGASLLHKGFTKAFSAIGKAVNGVRSKFKGLHKDSNNLADVAKSIFNKFTSYWNMFKTRIRRSLIAEVFGDFKANLGEFAKISPEFNQSVSSMIVSAKTLGAQIMAIAEPIVTVLGPVVSKFADMLTGIADKLAQFTARLTGKDTYIKATKQSYDYAKSLEEAGNTASKSRKKVKEYQNTVLGFDELNKLNGESTDTDASAITGLTGTAVEKAKTQANALNEIADKIHAAFTRHDYKGAGQAMAEAVNSGFSWLKDSFGWEKNGEKISKTLTNISETVNGFIEGFDAKSAGNSIADVFNTIIHSVDQLTDPTTGIHFKEAGLKVGEMLAQAFADTDWKTAGGAIMKATQGMIKFLTGIITAPDFGTNLGKAIHNAFIGIKDEFDVNTWSDFIAGVVNTLSDVLNEAFADPEEFGDFGKKLGDTVTEAFKKIDTQKLKSGVSKALKSIGNIISSVADSGDWEFVGTVLGDLLFSKDGLTNSLLDNLYTAGVKLGQGILDGLKGAVKSGYKTAMESSYNIFAKTQQFVPNLMSKGVGWLGNKIGLISEEDKKQYDNVFDFSTNGYWGMNRSNILREKAKNGEWERIIGLAFADDKWMEAITPDIEAMASNAGVYIAKEEMKAYKETMETLAASEANEGGSAAGGKDLGASYIQAVRDGVIGSKPELQSAVNDINDTLNDVGTNTTDEAKSKGQRIVEGIIEGITGKQADLETTLKTVMLKGIVGLSSFLMINSPSKLMADEIGQYIPAGIAVGIDSNADVIATSMESLGELTKNTASTMVDNTNNGSEGIMSGIIADSMRDALMETIMTADAGSGDGAQEIVLSVDGEDLARATVRGLRRIDKRTSAMVSFA